MEGNVSNVTCVIQSPRKYVKEHLREIYYEKSCENALDVLHLYTNINER